MTMPNEELRSVLDARDFIRCLVMPPVTPRVPRDIRLTASRILKHFPLECKVKDKWSDEVCLECMETKQFCRCGNEMQ